MFTSWKTTTAAIASVLATLLVAVSAALDSNPNTDPNWGVVIPVIMGQIGLLFARDNKVSDQDAGARPEPSKISL